jgi:hypothetical protein
MRKQKYWLQNPQKFELQFCGQTAREYSHLTAEGHAKREHVAAAYSAVIEPKLIMTLPHWPSCSTCRFLQHFSDNTICNGVIIIFVILTNRQTPSQRRGQRSNRIYDADVSVRSKAPNVVPGRRETEFDYDASVTLLFNWTTGNGVFTLKFLSLPVWRQLNHKNRPNTVAGEQLQPLKSSCQARR